MPGEIEFCLLGPLVVRRAGTVVPVSRGKQRAVLAVLLLNANRIVSVDELAEMLWGPDPPASARVTVQNYVKRLRHVLGDAERARTPTSQARTRLVTRHPGYLLQAAEDEVDVTRFRRLCRDGGTAVREGAWARADGLLGEALGLWRGAPLADVPSDLLVRDEVPGLEELRLQAEEWRADAALHLGRHEELVPALQALATRHPLRERFHAQLMLALYRCGRQADALAAYQYARHVLIDELGAEPGPDLRYLQQQVLSADPALVTAGEPAPAGESVPVFPYRGLSAFGEQDAGLFFGREDATARVLELMSGCLDGAGLVIVSGVSGAGKSSLLRAGVLPGLRRAGLAAAPEAALWPCLVFTPGRGPVAELAVQVAPLTGVDAAALRQQLTAGPAGFALTARQAALTARQAALSAAGQGGNRRRVVLVVDQCEQLFTACESAREREAFVTALHAAATGDGSGQPPAALVVLVVRADFEARLADVPQLAAAVQDRYLLTAMTRRQLRLAITGPAAAAGCGVAGDLVQVLLEEAGAQRPGPLPPGAAAGAGAGALPLLSHALDQAWRARAGQQLTLADYERAGGIEGAIAASAQRAYQALTPAQQHAARQIFTRLAVPGPDGTDTALPAARADLTAGTTAEQAADVEVVLERFAAERLLTLDAGTVAVSHEVLLTAWPLLRDDWLADARAARMVRARLHANATEWAQGSRDPSYLYSGSRLEAAAATAARIAADPRQLPLSKADTDFLHASQRASRRRARARRQLTAVLLALLAALTAVTVLAVRAGQAATAQRDISVSRQLIGQSQGDAGANATESRMQAIAAWALSPSPQARDAMLTAAANPQTATITADPGGVSSVAFSPDGTTLATSGPSGVRLWDLATGQQTGTTLAVGDQIFSLAFSPDGRTLATSGSTGVELWDVATGRPTSFGPEFTSVTFSPDGKALAASGPSGVQLWDVSADRQAGTLDGGHAISSVAFSPDGTTLATSGESGVQLWDVATGRQITVPLTSGDGVPITSIAFSPDGKTLATSTGDGTARLWNVATGRQAGKTFAGAGQLAPGPYHVACGSVAFSPDGKTLATCGSDTPRLWDVATGQQVSVPRTGGDGYPITSVAFSPDGTTLATGSQDGTARLWDVAALTFRWLGSLPADGSSQITAVGFSPDGKALATGTTDGTVQLWDLATGQQTGTTLDTGSQITAVAFSPDGATLATASWPGVRLWDTATGQPAGPPIAGADAAIDAMAFSPDGKSLTSLTAGGATQRWNVVTGRQTGDYPGPDAHCGACVMAFSPDGKTLAFMGNVSNSGVMLWSLATSRQAGQPLSGTVRLAVSAMAFSPDGQTLATGGPSGAQLWDVATGQEIGSPLTGSPVNAVAFSPDGKTLATAGPGGTLLWPVAPVTDALTHICTQAGGSLTPAAWDRYVPAGTPYLNPCPPTRAR